MWEPLICFDLIITFISQNCRQSRGRCNFSRLVVYFTARKTEIHKEIQPLSHSQERVTSFSWHDRLVVLQWKHFLALLLYQWKDQSLVKWMYMIIFFFFTSCIFNNSRPFLMGSNKWRWRWQITPITNSAWKVEQCQHWLNMTPQYLEKDIKS